MINKIRGLFNKLKPKNNKGISVEIYQQDWIPGFAAFLNDGSIKNGTAHICVNIGSNMLAVTEGDFDIKDVPYIITEHIMHEIIHTLESWANTEFNEERVEELLMKYREAYPGNTPELIEPDNHL